MVASCRIGVVGAGFVSQCVHLPFYSDVPSCDIAAVAENRPDLLAYAGERFGARRLYRDHGKMLEDHSRGQHLDGVIIAMPRKAQSRITHDVLDAGVPVLTEKPLAYRSDTARELLKTAERRGVPLVVGHMRRFDAGVTIFKAEMDRLMASGEMGAPLHIMVRDFCGAYTTAAPAHRRPVAPRAFRYPEDPVLPDDLGAHLPGVDRAALYDHTINVVTHDLDLLRLVSGAELVPLAMVVHARGARTIVLDAGLATVSLSVAAARPGEWDQQIELVFEQGSLVLQLDSPLALQSTGVVIKRGDTCRAVLRPPPAARISAFRAQADAFLRLLTEGKRDPHFDTEGAARDVALIEDLWRIAKPAGRNLPVG